jgi:uncharacterized SAM-binding protein YcdF (DUF218 family)
MRRVLRYAFVSLAAVMGPSLLLVGILSAQIHEQGEKDEARKADVIVVLGAAQWGGQPSPVLQARLDHAVRLYNRGLAPLIIVTGGVGEGEDLSEAEAAKDYLVAHGIPDAAVWMEQRGRTSFQSTQAAKQIMDEHGMRSALLVSDPFHMMRILKMARDIGIEAYGSPTRTSPISENRREECKYVRREIALYIVYVISRSLEEISGP